MGLAEAYGPFLPAVHRPFVLREAGRAPQKGLPGNSLPKQPKIPLRILRRDGRPVQGRRLCMALKALDTPTNFEEWAALAKNRNEWKHRTRLQENDPHTT